MAQRTCSVDDCERPHLAKGLCPMHYQRAKRLGSTELPAQRTCAVDGCDRKHFGRGYCNTHLKRLRTIGSLEVTPRVRKTCAFSGCGRPAASSSLCNGHIRQARKGGGLKPLRAWQKSTTRDPLGRKRCNTCAQWLHEASFYPNPKHADGLTGYCKRCDRAQRLMRNYGISVDQYEAMLAAQHGGCAICGTAPEDGASLHVDHDHVCCPSRKKSCGECVRGLLCEDCNRVLGTFRDDIGRFQAAIAYLTAARP